MTDRDRRVRKHARTFQNLPLFTRSSKETLAALVSVKSYWTRGAGRAEEGPGNARTRVCARARSRIGGEGGEEIPLARLSSAVRPRRLESPSTASPSSSTATSPFPALTDCAARADLPSKCEASVRCLLYVRASERVFGLYGRRTRQLHVSRRHRRRCYRTDHLPGVVMPLSIGVNLRVTGHCNQGGRKYMEDMFCVAFQPTPDDKDLEYAFFGIFDGHGGGEAATFAKEHLMDSIVKQKNFWSDRDEDVLRAIRDGYMNTHYAMWRELGTEIVFVTFARATTP